MLPRVVSVQPLHDCVLRLSFNDEVVRELDLEPSLWGPVFEPLRQDPGLFRRVFVDPEMGAIVWRNGVDMDPDVLHGDFEPASPDSLR